jgi:hypothetical protein
MFTASETGASVVLFAAFADTLSNIESALEIEVAERSKVEFTGLGGDTRGDSIFYARYVKFRN